MVFPPLSLPRADRLKRSESPGSSGLELPENPDLSDNLKRRMNYESTPVKQEIGFFRKCDKSKLPKSLAGLPGYSTKNHFNISLTTSYINVRSFSGWTGRLFP